MTGDEIAAAIRGEIVTEIPLGEQAKLESGAVGGVQ